MANDINFSQQAGMQKRNWKIVKNGKQGRAKEGEIAEAFHFLTLLSCLFFSE